MRTPSVIIRPITESDVPELLRLMRAIVSFERGQDFRLDEVELRRRGFGERPEFGAFVAETGSGSLVGMAVHYEIPFMHTLKPLLMLKWLYVDPACRGGHIGKRLMRQVALHARATGHDRFCWFVLQDNMMAQSFYRGLGTTEDAEWRRWIMPTHALNQLAESTEGVSPTSLLASRRNRGIFRAGMRYNAYQIGHVRTSLPARFVES